MRARIANPLAARQLLSLDGLHRSHLAGQPIGNLRPCAIVNGKRVERVRLKGDEMTLTTTTPGKPVKWPERRKMEGEFPELADKMHLPKFGRVEAISDSAAAGQLNDPFRPSDAVDVQLLGEDGQPDKATPLYRAVPLNVVEQLTATASHSHGSGPAPGNSAAIASRPGNWPAPSPPSLSDQPNEEGPTMWGLRLSA